MKRRFPLVEFNVEMMQNHNYSLVNAECQTIVFASADDVKAEYIKTYSFLLSRMHVAMACTICTARVKLYLVGSILWLTAVGICAERMISINGTNAFVH